MYSDLKMVSFRCSDIGTNCTYTILGRNKEELLRNIIKHAQRIHGMEDLPADLAVKIDSYIKVG